VWLARDWTANWPTAAEQGRTFLTYLASVAKSTWRVALITIALCERECLTLRG
jgi:hypothetical protein